MMKRCKHCGVEKEATKVFFEGNPQCRGGITNRCKDCRRVQVLAYKRKHSERIATSRREAYAADDGAKVKAREKARAAKDPWRVKAGRMRQGMIDRAINLGLPIDIEFFTVPVLMIWIANNRFCSCCGVEMDLLAKVRDKTHSVDRIIPALGYVRGNVAIICWRCNNLKRDATADELQRVVDWMRRVDRRRAA